MTYKLRITVAVSAILVAGYLILVDITLIRRVTVFKSAGVLRYYLTNNHTGLSHSTEETKFQFNNGDFPGLNKHTWEDKCLKSIQHLCNFPLFPKAPDSREVVNNIDIESGLSYGHRFLGYVHPNTSGEFHFAIASNGFAEVWLSANENWRQARRVAYVNPRDLKTPLKEGNFQLVKSQVSNVIQLNSGGKYYFEVTYSQEVENATKSFIQAAWSRQGRSDLEIIDGMFFSPFINDSFKSQRKMFDDNLPDAPSCVENKNRHVNKYMSFEHLPYLGAKAVANTLPYCHYKPSYLVQPSDLEEFRRFYGVTRYVRKTFSFPFTTIEGLETLQTNRKFVAESPLEEKEARAVVKIFIIALEKANAGKYKLESIVRVEKKEDPEKGSRYFLELQVKDLKTGSSHILAEYVYRPQKAKTTLCYPKGMKWNRTADVYLIVTSKNLGRWVHHFIKNMEQIVRETKDPHLHVVIFDFKSSDIDLKEAFKQSSLTNYHFITQPGKYSRGLSFTKAIKSVTDPNAIVVMIDLHLDIGSRFITDIRKHCLKGKTIYAPQIVFLNCSGNSALPKGKWYSYSYGTIAIYKQDWEKFKGFSPGYRRKVSWGGEDWDIIDKAVKGGLEVERKRGPWVYHYQHNKDGMW